MAGLKEIKRRIKSVTNTKKITYAMKLVATAKLRRAQEAVNQTRKYTEALNGLLAETLKGQEQESSFTHPLLIAPERVTKVYIVTVGANRGLCGGYNSNLNRFLEKLSSDLNEEHPQAALEHIILGRKLSENFRREKRSSLLAYDKLSDNPYDWPIEELADRLEKDFIAGLVSQVYLVFTRFQSAISVSPVCEKLLPIDAAALADNSSADSEEISENRLILFEPSKEAVFAALIPKLLRIRIMQASLDAKASEHGSRMTAMDSATKNAGDLMHRLQLKHNKLRQSGITAELLDIIGGASAIE